MTTNIKPVAWAKRAPAGDYLRSAQQMADTPEVEDGLTRYGWEPLYTRDALDAELAAERERCAKLVEDMRILPGRDFSSADAAEINAMGRAFAKAIRKGEQR